ncbi:DUF2202 domain-containing protein [Caenispirillum bisanense]|uniref:ferritin-like domain-containing protein n=1 Tax=Caenispirillum bisanense TaxID=414052 RepID=UPI0031D4D0C3
MSLHEALSAALDDEYKAIATYEAVLAAFGPVRPFVNIVEAERRHAAALLRQFDRLDLTPPADLWSGQVAAPASLPEAYAAGVAAEVENAALYDQLLAAARGEPEVTRVFIALRDASQDRHLPAFRRHLDGGAGRGTAVAAFDFAGAGAGGGCGGGGFGGGCGCGAGR